MNFLSRTKALALVAFLGTSLLSTGALAAGPIYINGSRVGEINSSGVIYKNGSRIGEITSNGYIYKNGSRVGEVPASDRIRAAAYYFFFWE